MPVPYYGDFPVNHTSVVIPFNSFTSDDPSASATITNFANTDVHIHKNGSLTQRASSSGVAIDIDVDAITGGHWITIDLSDNTDAGFYAAGSEISVRIEGVTIDGATVNAFVGAFSIERAAGALALAKLIQAATITNAAGADIAADIIAVKAETALIVADTNELQTDDTPGALAAMDAKIDVIDGIVDDILADTNELQTDDYPTSIAAIKAETALIVADTNELQTDDTPGALAAIDAKIDVIDGIVDTILVDTNELQTDWHDGGRLDLILDAAGGAGDPWITALPGAYGAGTAGKIIGDNINAPIATVDTVVDDIKTAVVTNAAGVDIAADIIAVKAETALIVADTNELQTDDTPGDLAAMDAKIDVIDGIVDDILADTNELQTDDYPTSIAAIKAETALIVADTNELQTDDYPTSIAAIKAETALIVADTNELQTDWHDGGRLDTILDTILVDTGTTLDDALQDALGNQTVIAGKIDVIDGIVDSILTDTGAIPSAAAIKTAMEAAGSDLDYLITALVNKMIITEANGNTEQFSDADVSLGSIATAFSTDGTYTTRKRLVI